MKSRKKKERQKMTGYRLAPLCLLSTAFCLLPTAYRPLSTVYANDEPIVRVASESLARADRLTLGDIAEIRAADSVVVERLRAVALGYAPYVGVVRELPRDRIALAITAAGFPAGTVRLETPPVVLIRRAAQAVAPELVRETVERITLTELRANGAAARLVRLDLPPAIEAPAGELEVRASIGGVRDLFAPFIVAVELWQTGRVVHRFSTTAQVEAFAPVVVAARDLPANVRVRKEDLVIEVRRLERAAGLYLRDETRLRGTSVRHVVARGEAITTDLLVAEIVIRPGDAVRIVSQADRLQIVALGEARSAGRIGDRIQVKNKESGLLLQAVIVDEGLVSVRF
jgi:flagellar basal body P-ring formation protein FlgA